MKIFFYFTILIVLSFKAEAQNEIIKIDSKNIELIKFTSPDDKFPGKDVVIAEIHLPKKKLENISVIIVQHGSNRDTFKFQKWDGKSDEWAKRIVKKGIENGYAVAVIDAFYKKGLKPGDKKKFPNASLYAIALKDILSEDLRFNKNNFFYTGFSFGGGSATKFLDERMKDKLTIPWKAIVSSEPPCNTVSYPIKIKSPILIIKGEESHYPVRSCVYYAKIIKEKGNNIELITIPKVNHFFSFNGKIVKGIAVNGCPDNIAFTYPDGSWKFADGTPSTRKEVAKKCISDRGGSGKTREKLDLAVDYTLNFFNKYNN